MSVRREQAIYKTFVLSTTLVIALVLSGVFLGMAVRTRRLMNEQNLIRARALLNSIVMMRTWNAQYGGVYVEKKKGVQSNPFLDHPDLKTASGSVLTLRNPALMTREVSEYAARQGLFRFHMTSLKLLNPANKPDAFEERALHAFEDKGAPEISREETEDGRTSFRYMAPLFTEQSCMPCHEKQGYRVGSVRGGISISFDISDLQKKLRMTTISIALFGITTTGLLMGLIWFFTARLIGALAGARKQIETLAITDELTGLFNRRHIMARFREEFEKAQRLNRPLSCIMADIDHFKSINDRFGHQMGDETLREITRRLREVIRAYDIPGRYGGEEYLILLPDTTLDDARGFSERIRHMIRETPFEVGFVTMSLGVASRDEVDRSIDDIINRADKRLYAAKNKGRDCTE